MSSNVPSSGKDQGVPEKKTLSLTQRHIFPTLACSGIGLCKQWHGMAWHTMPWWCMGRGLWWCEECEPPKLAKQSKLSQAKPKAEKGRRAGRQTTRSKERNGREDSHTGRGKRRRRRKQRGGVHMHTPLSHPHIPNTLLPTRPRNLAICIALASPIQRQVEHKWDRNIGTEREREFEGLCVIWKFKWVEWKKHGSWGISARLMCGGKRIMESWGGWGVWGGRGDKLLLGVGFGGVYYHWRDGYGARAGCAETVRRV